MPDRFILSAVCAFALFCAVSRAGEAPEASREHAFQLLADGNYREAKAIFRRLAFDPAEPPEWVVANLHETLFCMERLGDDPREAERMLDDIAAARPTDWRVLAAAAHESPVDGGIQIPATPWSGVHRSRHARPYAAFDRARVRALRLFLEAEKHLDNPADPADADDRIWFYHRFANLLRAGREDARAWRLTALTDLSAVPEAEDETPYWAVPARGAPVDENGDPVYHRVPESWDAAKNDGERWRWILSRMADLGETGRDTARWLLAEFLLSQFGVQTMTQQPGAREAELAGESGPFAVRTLRDDETIARLGGGLKRFAMPEEFNHILLLRLVAESNGDALRDRALSLLASVFENRQQYPKAVDAWRRLLRAQRGEDAPLARAAEASLERITANSGALEPAGGRKTLSYLFRNGDSVRFAATRLDEKLLLADIRAALKSRDRDFLENYLHRRPEALARFVLEDGGKKYLGETAAEWTLDLDPLPDHFSRRIDVALPPVKPGCYLVEAEMQGGNTSRIVLWLADLALVRKDARGEQMFFVADADTGEPVAGATVDFLGVEWFRNDARERDYALREFAGKTDENGLLFAASEKMDDREWLITATTSDGGLAYTGFDHVWSSAPDPEESRPAAAFLLTDRPVYRPGQTVRFKAWIGRAAYTPRPGDSFAGRPAQITVHNPRGEVVYDRTLTADGYGGVEDSFTTGDGALLGNYFISLSADNAWNRVGGGVAFRLEEYKKPEFEATLAVPDKALVLGDSAQLKVSAAYYHGAPVTDAKVAYKILRTPHAAAWVPLWRWDWLYGAGAWRIKRDSAAGPFRHRMAFRHVQPELVAEGEGELDAEGAFRFTLDTAPAKQLFGHEDHEYSITFEVTDKSRRTIAGSGRVVAAREPFAVTVWTERGYHRPGDEIRAEVKALLPLGGGVAAEGEALLYRITHDEAATARETEVERRPIATDADGSASLRFRAGVAGQYRLSVRLREAGGNTRGGKMVEGSTAALTVRGESGAGDFRFSPLELVPDKREYAPGETLRLAVNSENRRGFVLLLPRAERGNARPLPVRLDNGSHIADIPVGRGDQPNFFCEALTVFDGEVHSEVREIFVPPAEKTLRVTVESDKDSYLPGEKAAFTLAVTDGNGAPVAGQCAISLYDKSVEYVSGGSNAIDIRRAFWSWKRHYGANIVSSLMKHSYPVEREGDKPWLPIGVFGGEEADWNNDELYTNALNPVSPRMLESRFAAAPMAVGGAPVMGRAAAETAMDFAAPAAPMTAKAADAFAGGTGGAPDGGAMVEAAVRSEFADTAFWTAALETDGDGRAAFTVDMPENLTAWKARVWVMGMETRVGEGGREVATRKNVIVRPQAPRFLTQKDQVILSANLHNYLPRAKAARAELVLDGGLLEAEAGASLTREVALAAGGEARVDWLVTAKRPGTATVVMKLLTDEESDAAEITLPVIVHGARRVENFGAVLRPEETRRSIRFTVPEERLPDQSRLEFSFSPSLALPLLEALPYLIDYPYGCTEQTLNRFLPALMARKYLDAHGLSLADAKAMIARSAGRDDAQSAEWREKYGDDRASLRKLPVFDDAELDRMVAAGIERLAGMQNADGGWGWFSGAGERSWPHTTAVVVYGLAKAEDAGAPVPPQVLERGLDWLSSRQMERIALLEAKDDGTKKRREKADNLDAFVHLVLTNAEAADPRMRDFLYRDRQDLSLTGLAMLGLSLEAEGRAEELAMVARNLSQFVETNPENGAAWLSLPAHDWWRWHNDAVETQAWYLKLLAKTDPHSALTAGVAKYLLENRKNGSYWRSTRDTAGAVEALADYAAASGETAPDMTVKLYLDGKPVRERRLAKENMLEDNRFVLDSLAVEAGEHELLIERAGAGALYCTGSLSVFSLEDPVPAAGGPDLKVSRTFYKLTPAEKTVELQTSTGASARAAAEKYERTALPGASGSVEAGDLIEVELAVTAANEYEYLVFEDMKAAGLEAVELRSGYGGNNIGAYVEYRDEKVTLFIRHLPRGVHRLAYRFRAEIPGAYSALPVFGGGMYATDLFCNSDEMKIRVVEEGTFE